MPSPSNTGASIALNTRIMLRLVSASYLHSQSLCFNGDTALAAFRNSFRIYGILMTGDEEEYHTLTLRNMQVSLAYAVNENIGLDRFDGILGLGRDRQVFDQSSSFLATYIQQIQFGIYGSSTGKCRTATFD